MKFIILFSLLSQLLYAAPTTWDKIKKSGKIRIAVDTTYPPMEFEDIDGNVIGYDVDLAKSIATKLGLKAEFIVMPWDGIIPGLTSDRYDVIMSSMNITPERAKAVNFVKYMDIGQIFVLSKRLTQFKTRPFTKNDLKGMNVAVQSGTTSEVAVEKFQKEGIKIASLKPFKGSIEAFQALKSKQADVIVVDDPVGRYYAMKDKEGTFFVSGEAISPEPIGIAFNKVANDNSLKEKLESALKAIESSGEMKKIRQQWFGK